MDAEQLPWLLFIYTLPSQPSRKRAYVWRELKRLGSVYLRDGVALLPRRPDLEQRMQAVVERVEQYEGSADLVRAPPFAAQRDAQLIGRFREERGEEYRELYHACVRFLRDVLQEVDADDFGFPGVENLEGELGRLHRWKDQVQERDYFAGPGLERVEEILGKCDRAFERFAGTAHERLDGERRPQREDVFERLGGPPMPEAEVQEDFPL
ncbi:MAG: hypothetical protein JOZ41_15080 [Chloroflexi bacterium]|nr:hypothetical protein [Chloroflexota bacterium]